MNWQNPVPGQGWYCTQPVPAAIWTGDGKLYVAVVGKEQQQASTLAQAQQIAHDMVFAVVVKAQNFQFRPFTLDVPSDQEQITVVLTDGSIASGKYSVANNNVTRNDGTVIASASLLLWDVLPTGLTS